MPVLCIDTASVTPVAVLLGDAPEADRGAVGAGRAQEVLALADELLAGASPDSIDAVVVGTGPGGFTGLRVGIATARGIAETLGVPLYGVSSLLAVAARQVSHARGEVVWAVVDARRGECFAQPWRLEGSGAFVPVEPTRTVAAADVEALVGQAGRAPAGAPSPESLALASRQVLGAAADGDPLTVVPAYGREPDAQPPKMDVRIDELREADLDAVMVLERRCFPTPWSRAMYAEELRRPTAERVQLAARDERAGGRLLGAALAARIGDGWHVMNVLVEPAARRRGIASRLIERLVEQTAERGTGDGWTLEVRAGNDAAIALYRRHGFAIAGRRAGYYRDTGEDALVMWRTDPAPAAAVAEADQRSGAPR